MRLSFLHLFFSRLQENRNIMVKCNGGDSTARLNGSKSDYSNGEQSSRSRDSSDEKSRVKKSNGSVAGTSSDEKDYITVNESFSRTDDTNSEDNHEEDGKLFVGALSSKTTSPMLLEYFEQYGRVRDAIVMRDLSTGQNRCFGFVSYEDRSVADIVLAGKHFINGKLVDVKKAIPRTDYERSDKIFVGGLPQSMTNGELRSFFEDFGPVLEAQVMTKKDSGKARGFGFVTFKSERTVSRIMVRQTESRILIKNKKVEVKRALPKHKLPMALPSSSSSMVAAFGASSDGPEYLAIGHVGGELPQGCNQNVPLPASKFRGKRALKSFPARDGLDTNRKHSFHHFRRPADGIVHTRRAYPNAGQYQDQRLPQGLITSSVIGDGGYASQRLVGHGSVISYPVSPLVSSNSASPPVHMTPHIHPHGASATMYTLTGISSPGNVGSPMSPITNYYQPHHPMIYSVSPHIAMPSSVDGRPHTSSHSGVLSTQLNIAPSYGTYMYYPGAAPIASPQESIIAAGPPNNGSYVSGMVDTASGAGSHQEQAMVINRYSLAGKAAPATGVEASGKASSDCSSNQDTAYGDSTEVTMAVLARSFAEVSLTEPASGIDNEAYGLKPGKGKRNASKNKKFQVE